MNIPSVVHPTTFEFLKLKIQLRTFEPLSQDLAARVVQFWLHTQVTPAERRKKGTRQVLWHGDAAAAAALPPPQLRPPSNAKRGAR